MNLKKEIMVGTALCALAFGATAHAQTAPQAQPEPAVKSEDVSEVVVTGFKKSYADAVRMKRSAVEITDSISSDGLGRFPDLNVGEALQRIPGVQLNREADGRNATINLRGLPGEYAKLTLNGVAFAEPILTDAAPLGAFNSDIFSAISVEKSPTAGAQSGGLSGNIDLQIAPALGRKDGGFLKTTYEYNQLGGLGAPGVTVGYNKHFTDDFAVFGVVAYKKEKFRRDSVFFNNYTPLNATTTPNFASLYADYYAAPGTCTSAITGCLTAPTGTGLKGKTGVLYPSQIRQVVRYNEGTLLSAAGGFEYKPNDDTKIGVTGFKTDRKENGTYQNLLIVDLTQAGTVISPTSPVTTLSNGQFLVQNYDFSNPDALASTRLLPQHQATWGLNGNIDWKNDAWRLATVATWSKASNSSVETEFDSDTILPPTGTNGITGSLASGAGNIGDFAFSLSPNPATSVTGPWYWAGNSNPTSWYNNADPTQATNRIQVTGTQSYATNELKAVQQDVEKFLSGGVFSSIQGGVRYESNKYVSTGYRTMAYGLQMQNVDSNFVIQSPFANDFFNGAAGAYTTNWQAADMAYVLSKLKPATVYPGGALSPLGFNIRYSDNSYSLYNFTNQTDLSEAYVEGKFDHNVLSIPVRGNVGVRYESAENTVTALDRTTVTNGNGLPSDFVTNVYKQKYHNVLPSAVIVADLTDDLVLRAAAYKTYVRPQPRQFSPVTVVSYSGAASNAYSVTLGNPDLKPYKATSYDVSLEWYNRPNGIVSIDVFQKDITGLLAQVSGAANLCPSDGSPWGLGTLTVEGDVCYSSLPSVNGVRATVTASGYVNQSNPIKVNGVEFSVQQNLDFLPAPWSNLGGAFNYAYTDISGKNANGTKATLPGVSKNNVNLIGYYETSKFGVRFVYNYRTNYDLAAAGTFSGAARSVKARGQLDVSASYNVTDNVSVSLDGFNLTNEIRYEYENQTIKPRRADYDGRTYQMTIRATF